jgi:hypothetical protein
MNSENCCLSYCQPIAGHATKPNNYLIFDYNNLRLNCNKQFDCIYLCDEKFILKKHRKETIMKIVATGSLGHISKPLTAELLEKGHAVTVVSSKVERKRRYCRNIKRILQLFKRVA